ncbi:MAG: hypothetical protein [Bacteriophage sp.]|nr:MAG: hypothetical protein [Bacteriophage sp.]
MIFNKITKWWQSFRFYIIADPADNSVTLSKALFNHMKDNAHEGDEARIFVFKITDSSSFGFMANPSIEQPTQMCDIQYNGKYRCIGFETLCPSVGQILYTYGLNASQRVKLSVSVCRTVQGKVYYQIERPHEKHIRKYKKG